MRIERLLVGPVALLACAAAAVGAPIVQDLIGSPIAAEFRLPGSDPQAVSPASDEIVPRDEAVETGTARSGNPADAFRSPAARSSATPEVSRTTPKTVPDRPSTVVPPVESGGDVPVSEELALTVSDPEVTAHEAALAWLASQRGLFGVGLPGRSLRPYGPPRVVRGRVAVDFRQFVGDLPVLDALVTVNMSKRHVVVSASGETTQAGPSAAAGRTVDADTALRLARAVAPDTEGVATSAAELWIVDPELVGATVRGPARPMWRVFVTSDGSTPEPGVGTTVLVDARTAEVTVVGGPEVPVVPTPEPGSALTPQAVPAPSAPAPAPIKAAATPLPTG